MRNQMEPTQVIKNVKAYGNSCCISVPKSWEGKSVIACIIPKGTEIEINFICDNDEGNR